MAYKNAENVLPRRLLEAIQQYVDGECVYIPRKESNRKGWGESKNTKKHLEDRNARMVEQYRRGNHVRDIASRHCLSVKAVYKILAASRGAGNVTDQLRGFAGP